ncbi:MAG: hypothetical protein HDQ91_04480 [Desulfovibrio sp.]|nr:hypothetical protein [Desulfovibrio sp.]
MVRPYLKNIAYIDERFSECIPSTGFYVWRPNKDIDSKFLFLLIARDYVVNGLNKFMRGDNSPSIKPEHIEDLAYPIQTKEIQKYISQFLNTFCTNRYFFKED